MCAPRRRRSAGCRCRTRSPPGRRRSACRRCGSRARRARPGAPPCGRRGARAPSPARPASSPPSPGRRPSPPPPPASMSAADEDATSAMVSPVAGSSTASTPPSMPSRHSPPMKLPRIPVVTAAPSRRRGARLSWPRAGPAGNPPPDARSTAIDPLAYVAPIARRRRGVVDGGASREEPQDGGATEAFVERVAERRLQLLQLGAQVLPRGLPRDAGHPRRGPHADGLPRQRGGDGAGRDGRRGHRPRLRPLHPVRGLRAALPEHPLHRGLLPLPHPHGGPGQGGAGAGRRRRRPPAGLAGSGTGSRTTAATSRCWAARRSTRRTCADWAEGLGAAGGRRDGALLRLRGRLPPHLACRGRSPASCRRPASSSASCASSGAAGARRPRWATSSRRGASPSTTSPTGGRSARSGSSSIDPHDYISFTEDYPRFFGDDFDFEIVLAVELVAELVRDGRLALTEPVERVVTYHDACRLNKRKGIHERAARDPARDPGPDLQGRRPRDPVVLLLRARARGLGIERPDLTAEISRRRVERAADLGVDTLVSACVWSERPLQRGRRRPARADRGDGPDGAGRPRLGRPGRGGRPA